MKKTKVSYLLRGTPSALLMLGAGFVMASSADIRAALGMGAAVVISIRLTRHSQELKKSSLFFNHNSFLFK